MRITDTTVIPANAAYSTDSGLLAKAVGKLVRRVQGHRGDGTATARRVRQIAGKLRSRESWPEDQRSRELTRTAASHPSDAAPARTQLSDFFQVEVVRCNPSCPTVAWCSARFSSHSYGGHDRGERTADRPGGH
jgi:hypothetical protein